MAHLTLSGRIYLDTNIFIYALEGYPVFRAVLTTLFNALDRGELMAVTSELTLAEVLVKPLLDRHAERQAAYLQVLQPSLSLHMAPVSRDVFLAAARLRAETGLKLPDAIMPLLHSSWAVSRHPFPALPSYSFPTSSPDRSQIRQTTMNAH